MDNTSFNELFQRVSKILGTDSSNVKKSVEKGNVSNLFKGLDPKEADKIKAILSDKKATEKILATEQAQQLLKKFMK